MRSPHRGAQLPYQTLAGVVPCHGGWLAAAAKLQGITLSPEPPQVFASILDVVDYKPAYQVIALFAPIGLLDKFSKGGRTCDREARRVLQWPRSGAILSAPARSVLVCRTLGEARDASGGRLSPVTWRQWRRFAEVDAHVAPYWQRNVFEVHPELAFFQLNDDKPVRYSKHTRVGQDERRGLLTPRFPGVERILDARVGRVSRAQLLDAAACLWTARRITSRAVQRLPEDPEWDSLGLRMEIVR